MAQKPYIQAFRYLHHKHKRPLPPILVRSNGREEMRSKLNLSHQRHGDNKLLQQEAQARKQEAKGGSITALGSTLVALSTCSCPRR